MQRPRPTRLSLLATALLLAGCPGLETPPEAIDDDDDMIPFGTTEMPGGTTEDPSDDPASPDVPDPTTDPTADPTGDPTGDPGAVVPGLFPLSIESIEQVAPAPQAFAAMLGYGPTVVVAGASGSLVVDLTDPEGASLEVGPGLGSTLTPRPNEDVWDWIVYGGDGGAFAYGVDSEGVLDFGYDPFGVGGPPFVTDMRVAERDGEQVLAYAAGTEAGFLTQDSLWTHDFQNAVFVEAALGVALPSGNVADPWFVVADGIPGALYDAHDPLDPVAPLGDSPRLGACSQVGTPDWARCGVPNFAAGTVQFFDVAEDGTLTVQDAISPGGQTVRVYADDTGPQTVWHMPLFDHDALALCTGTCDSIVTVEVPCDGPGHSTVVAGTWLVVSCNIDAQLWVAEAQSVYAALFE